MRRIISIIATVAALALLSSCRGEPGINGIDGRDGVGVVQTIEIEVPEEAWQYSNLIDNNYYYATVSMPELNSTMFKKGLIKMYRYFDYGSTQMEMPYVKLAEEFVGGSRFFYTEAVDYEFSVNSLTIFFTASDFIYEDVEDKREFAPEAMQFRCVIMY